MDEIRKDILPKVAPGIRTSVQQVAVIGGGGAQGAEVQFVINGPDLRKLEVLSRQLLERVKNVPGAVDVDTSMNVGKPELSIQVDRPRPPISACRSATPPRPAPPGRRRPGDDLQRGRRAVKCTARSRRESLDRGGDRQPHRASSRLGSVASTTSLTSRPGRAVRHQRLARQRQVPSSATSCPARRRPRSECDARRVQQDEPGQRIRGAFTGRSRELAARRRTSCSRSAVAGVHVFILAAQFESWLHPITILLSLPLTLPSRCSRSSSSTSR
jgi:HAE1 family hydrophobic/amphiphilic exporter-1